MYDIAIMGNAPVDALVNVTEDVLLKHNLKKGDFQTRGFNDFLALNDDCVVEKFEAGGSTANTAYAMGKLGSHVSFISRFGADASGKHFKSEMAGAGVTVSAGDDTVRTMEIFVLITPDGERTFVSPGVTAPMSDTMIDEKTICESKWLLVEGYLLFDQYEAVTAALKVARENGIKTALTLASSAVLESCYDAIATEVDRGLDLILANDEEMAVLLKAAKEGGHEVLLSSTPRIITSSGDGATFTDGTEEITIPTVKIDHPVDSTGAGDAFAAGFLHHYIQDGDVEEGIKLGHKLAASVIMRTGARVQDEAILGQKAS
jgi:sugar/nucleoside kinase (ribokinase family)